MIVLVEDRRIGQATSGRKICPISSRRWLADEVSLGIYRFDRDHAEPIAPGGN